jgi:signal transduction histidine kinase
MSDVENAQSAPGLGGRILIVDDVLDNRAILARRFQRRGFEVVEATGGKEALELIASQPLDLVLLDWMMVDMQGPEVLKIIRAHHPAELLPVIMVTAKTQSEDVVEALNNGANDYVTKPIDFPVILARTEAQIGRKRAEEQVRQTNQALEIRIAERTAELVEANARLRGAVDAAESANRAKDQFLSNISHELRTPLNGVIAMSQLLRTTALNPSQTQMLDVIAQSGQALHVVVANLLDIVELRSSAVELTPETFELGALVAETVAAIRGQAEGKGLTLGLDVAAEAVGAVHTDPKRLRRVLMDLLGNAVKFTERGSVSVSVRRQPSAEDRILIEVADTGIGFAPELAERLFQPFQQADSSTTRAHGGTGLGLAISRELVHRMGGSITAEGRPGEGATFRVELPLPRIRTAA